MKKKLVLFAVFASLLAYASAIKPENPIAPNTTIAGCCDPPPICPKNCPPVVK
jgi:hypothetical protein